MVMSGSGVAIALPARSCVLKSRLAAFVGTASGRTAGFIGAAASVQADLVWWSCMRPQLTCNLGPAKQLSAQKDPRKKQALSCVFEPGLLTCVGHASWLAACRIVAAASVQADLARWSCMRSGITRNFDPNVSIANISASIDALSCVKLNPGSSQVTKKETSWLAASPVAIIAAASIRANSCAVVGPSTEWASSKSTSLQLATRDHELQLETFHRACIIIKGYTISQTTQDAMRSHATVGPTLWQPNCRAVVGRAKWAGSKSHRCLATDLVPGFNLQHVYRLRFCSRDLWT